MSKKNYQMTTALVASVLLSFPQSVLAQESPAADTVMLCLDKSSPPCPAGEPTEGTATPASDAATPSETPAPDTAVPAEPEVPAADDTNVAPSDGSTATPEEAVAPETAPTEDASTPAAPAPAADAGAGTTDTTNTTPPADTAPSAEAESQVEATAAGADAQPTEVTEETVGADVRSSSEEFSTNIDGGAEASAEATATADNNDDGLSKFEKALLLGLGAVAVGSLLDDGSKVVSNTGDRVVVDRNGQLVIYKDDDALLFREGTNVRTETFADGSSRTYLIRADGSEIVTIRDAEGRVLRRTRVAQDGSKVVLFDDTVQAEAIDAPRLATYTRVDSIAFSASDEAALRAALQAETDADRTFSLRQIRETEEIRSLVASVDLDTINFATGSAAIPVGQIEDLKAVGKTMEEMLIANPREVFLIEGHTDAVGDAVSNLALSDRRAESVALALSESFEIPPENLVVQGYGAQFLKVETDAAEQANRRATVRRITPLLKTVSMN